MNEEQILNLIEKAKYKYYSCNGCMSLQNFADDISNWFEKDRLNRLNEKLNNLLIELNYDLEINSTD